MFLTRCKELGKVYQCELELSIRDIILFSRAQTACPLKMPATETGEMLERTTFRTQPKSLKNPQQPLDPGRESLHEYSLGVP